MSGVRFSGKRFVAVLCVSLCADSAAFAADIKAAEQAGAALFREKGCSFCHGANRQGTRKAPALDEIRLQKAWTDKKITNQILDGGQNMPPFRESLSDDEIAQLIAFLRSKSRSAPNVSSDQREDHAKQ